MNPQRQNLSGDIHASFNRGRLGKINLAGGQGDLDTIADPAIIIHQVLNQTDIVWNRARRKVENMALLLFSGRQDLINLSGNSLSLRHRIDWENFLRLI